MARVKLSPIITQASGSIGGITLQRNKYGMTMREKPLPSNPFTSGQYTVRQRMTTVQKAWQDLTDAQRLQWDRFLDFSGQSIKRDKSVKLSGHSLFLKYQVHRLISGEAMMTTIQYVPMPEMPAFSQFDMPGGFLMFDLASTCTAADLWYTLRVSSPRIPGRAFSARGLRVVTGVYQNHTQLAIYTSYLAAFGVSPSVGDTLHYSIQFFSWKSPIVAGRQTGVAIIQA